MRYELKHDKLAAHIFVQASAAAKLRRRAGEVYTLYEEIGSQRTFSPDELQYFQQFLPVLSPSEKLQQYIQESQKVIEANIAAEKIESERLALAEEKAQHAEEEARLRKEAEKARRRANWGTAIAVGLAIVAITLGFFAFRQRNEARSQESKAKKSAQEVIVLNQELIVSRNSADSLRKIAEKRTQETTTAYQKLRKETKEKEQLLFSNKVDFIQSFVKAGYCKLAQKALEDLMLLVKRYPDRADFQKTARELHQRIQHCQPLDTQE